MSDEWTWEERQDTLDYMQWMAEQEAQRELDRAITNAQLQFEAEYEEKLMAEHKQLRPFAVEVRPPQHVIEQIVMEMEGEYSADELRFVVYNDTERGEWLRGVTA